MASKKVTAISLLLMVAVLSHAQHRNAYYNEYIKKYAPLAVEQMKRHKIPASITLAQGLLESAAGRSQLARSSNNHFGIKCGSNWRGRSVSHDDDARGECFRAYKTVEESYEDHSIFLQKPRYAGLFKLSITDYRGWAKELKRAGYATDPSYANRLITIIEDYELYTYDAQGTKHQAKPQKKKEETGEHQVYIGNGLAYVVARQGDTFKSLSKEVGISSRKLAKYNDVEKNYPLEAGDIVYLTKKHKHAVCEQVNYRVVSGDSMHSIAQKFGVRLKNLYQLNKLTEDYTPEVGDMIWLK